MTMSSPSSGPTLLASLLHAEHERLQQLLGEASANPPTPGVMADIRRNLAEELRGHVNAEAAVVHGAVRDVLGSSAHDDVRRDALQMERALVAVTEAAPDGLPDGWQQRTYDALAEHRALLEDELLPELADRDPDLMGNLGYRYSEAVEVSRRRPPRP
jgi:hypothetical protein